MDIREAVALIAGAVPKGAGTWADVGAGDGTFTRALARLLGPDGRVFAVDRDARALAAIETQPARNGAQVIPVTADFTGSFDLPGLEPPGLDGALLANALHFVPDPGAVLARIAQRVRPGGRVVLIEYDGRPANRWIPYPVPVASLPALGAAAGLGALTVTATRPSAYVGILYVAVAVR